MEKYLTVNLRYNDDEKEFLVPLTLTDFFDSYQKLSDLELAIENHIKVLIEANDLEKDFLEDQGSSDNTLIDITFTLHETGVPSTLQHDLDMLSVETNTIKNLIIKFFKYHGSGKPDNQYYVTFYNQTAGSIFKKASDALPIKYIAKEDLKQQLIESIKRYLLKLQSQGCSDTIIIVKLFNVLDNPMRKQYITVDPNDLASLKDIIVF